MFAIGKKSAKKGKAAGHILQNHKNTKIGKKSTMLTKKSHAKKVKK